MLPVLRPMSNTDACHPFPPTTLPQHAFVLLLDRGNCTFVEKLSHATQLGAQGVIVSGVGSPPPDSSNSNSNSNSDSNSNSASGMGLPVDEDGLIRPSGDGEPEEITNKLKESGMVYVDTSVGEVVRSVLERGIGVGVEVLGLDFGMGGEDGGGGDDIMSGMGMGMGMGNGMRGGDQARGKGMKEGEGEGEGGGTGQGVREGRVQVGNWVIWNLRIVEEKFKPP